MESKITFLCLGGPKNCMPLRMEKIVEKFKTLIKDPKKWGQSNPYRISCGDIVYEGVP